MDGIWKLRYFICMYFVKIIVAGFEVLNFFDVCINVSYGKGSVFCEDYCRIVTVSGIFISLRDFLREYCGLFDKCGKRLICEKY